MTPQIGYSSQSEQALIWLRVVIWPLAPLCLVFHLHLSDWLNECLMAVSIVYYLIISNRGLSCIPSFLIIPPVAFYDATPEIINVWISIWFLVNILLLTKHNRQALLAIFLCIAILAGSFVAYQAGDASISLGHNTWLSAQALEPFSLFFQIEFLVCLCFLLSGLIGFLLVFWDGRYQKFSKLVTKFSSQSTYIFALFFIFFCILFTVSPNSDFAHDLFLPFAPFLAALSAGWLYRSSDISFTPGPGLMLISVTTDKSGLWLFRDLSLPWTANAWSTILAPAHSAKIMAGLDTWYRHLAQPQADLILRSNAALQTYSESLLTVSERDGLFRLHDCFCTLQLWPTTLSHLSRRHDLVLLDARYVETWDESVLALAEAVFQRVPSERLRVAVWKREKEWPERLRPYRASAHLIPLARGFEWQRFFGLGSPRQLYKALVAALPDTSQTPHVAPSQDGIAAP